MSDPSRIDPSMLSESDRQKFLKSDEQRSADSDTESEQPVEDKELSEEAIGELRQTILHENMVRFIETLKSQLKFQLEAQEYRGTFWNKFDDMIDFINQCLERLDGLDPDEAGHEKLLELLDDLGYCSGEPSKELTALLSESESVLKSFKTPTEQLPKELLTDHLDFRKKYMDTLKLYFGDSISVGVAEGVVRSANFDFDEFSSLPKEEGKDRDISQELYEKYYSREWVAYYAKWCECQLIYSSFLLAPSESTEGFINKINSVIDQSSQPEIMDHCPLLHHSFLGFAEGEIADRSKISLMKAIKEGKFDFYSDKRIFEVGGNAAARALSVMGAEVVEEADAGGAGGYTGGGGIKKEEKVISLRNYTHWTQPHSVDLVLSAQLFDHGSGIGFIAEPKDNEEKTPDKLGMEEMTLLMGNIIKDRSFMIHDEVIPGISTTAGFDVVGSLHFGDMPGNNNAYVYRKNNPPQENELQIGKKTVAFSPETKTWELTN